MRQTWGSNSGNSTVWAQGRWQPLTQRKMVPRRVDWKQAWRVHQLRAAREYGKCMGEVEDRAVSRELCPCAHQVCWQHGKRLCWVARPHDKRFSVPVVSSHMQGNLIETQDILKALEGRREEGWDRTPKMEQRLSQKSPAGWGEEMWGSKERDTKCVYVTGFRSRHGAGWGAEWVGTMLWCLSREEGISTLWALCLPSWCSQAEFCLQCNNRRGLFVCL